MVIEIESVESRPLETIIDELTMMICRDEPDERVNRVARKVRVNELLSEFAEEIKRQSIEP